MYAVESGDAATDYRVWEMDEVWERAVETALDGQTDYLSARTLTLDGAVKCLHGRLPPPNILEKFQGLEHLSIANVGVSSLEKFPRLRNLQKLILSDNRIAGGLEFLVEAGLESLRDLDLSNNRIQFLEDLRPLAQLRLVSLDLYECPVTRIKDYRSRVFGMIKSLKYLDKMDADENERPESDEEEEDEEDEEEDDPGSGEVDGDDRSGKLTNGSSTGGIVDADEDDESDADEEEPEVTGVNNGFSRNAQHHANGFRVAASGVADEDEDDVEDEEDDDLGEEIDEEEGDEEDVVVVHEIDDSDEDEDGVEDDEEDEEEEDVEDEEEEGVPESTGRILSTEGEIDGHEHGEDQGDEDENGEIGEEDEQEIEEDGEYKEDDGEGDDEEEDFGSEYLVQPIRGQVKEVGSSDVEAGNNEDDGEEEEVEDEEETMLQPSSSSLQKRKRDTENDGGSIEDDERSSKRQ
ncbi:acidic leucine-rich nuclear phosphoprotein 32-related protein-like [Aristolochia californica]|uniref:acidic leucine-rich nuclear phosphoprotein 32-related protein-like n=1 Tax=Aristolochia californica TaxID=171875 RepID=UPI0035E3B4FA